MLLRALDKIAGLLDHGCDALTLDWPQVRYQHSQVVRTMLAAKYAPSKLTRHRVVALKRPLLVFYVEAHTPEDARNRLSAELTGATQAVLLRWKGLDVEVPLKRLLPLP